MSGPENPGAELRANAEELHTYVSHAPHELVAWFLGMANRLHVSLDAVAASVERLQREVQMARDNNDARVTAVQDELGAQIEALRGLLETHHAQDA